MEVTKKIINVRNYKVGYQIRTVRFTGDDAFGSEDMIRKQAYTPSGHYIGTSKVANQLCKKMGIVPELASPSDTVCSVGFCKGKEQWFGWSHRAIIGFGLGDRIFEHVYGDDNTPFGQHGEEVIETLDQARVSAVSFADYVG